LVTGSILNTRSEYRWRKKITGQRTLRYG